MPLTADFAQPPLAAFGDRIRCRSIYAAAMMDDPAARQNIRDCVQAGEEARLLPHVPMKLKLADQATALLPLTPAGAAALVIRAPVILAALREYFELLWDRATPLTVPPAKPGADQPSPAQQKVLELMVLGLADDAIASRLGVSTGTVRRHITAMSTRLGVSSRFALGAAAHRRDWIG
jgi:DNA-binding NarL/FixJ family response regulator